MAKYYVQSGNVRTVISADDHEKAALWVVHRTLKQVVPVYDDSEMSADEKSDAAVVEGVMVLGNTIRINEVGFDQTENLELDTFELVVHWHQLMIALDRLEELIS